RQKAASSLTLQQCPLCGYVWPSEASGSTMRKRRQRVREALPELVALGWTVTEFAAGKYDITRPKAAG
ncbi:TPA: replication protein C, IncQ-type, partial [Escherichia coli]